MLSDVNKKPKIISIKISYVNNAKNKLINHVTEHQRVALKQPKSKRKKVLVRAQKTVPYRELSWTRKINNNQNQQLNLRKIKRQIPELTVKKQFTIKI
jgi:biopolymer transport protein ExbD